MFTLQSSCKPLLLWGRGEGVVKSVSRGDCEKQGVAFVPITSKNSASGEGCLWMISASDIWSLFTKSKRWKSIKMMSCYITGWILQLLHYLTNFLTQSCPSKEKQYCIAPVVWSFLSTTTQLYATHRKSGQRRKRHCTKCTGLRPCWRNLRQMRVSGHAGRSDVIMAPPPPHSTCKQAKFSDI